MSLSVLAQQKILRQQAKIMFPYFIEITSSEYGTFYYVNADEDREYTDENGITHTYTACCFTIQPPDKTESKIGDAKITFSAIYNNSEWIKKIRQMEERATIRIVAAIIYENGNEEGIEPIYNTEFTLADCSWNESEISWAMKFDEGMDIIMPCDVMDEINCPAIV